MRKSPPGRQRPSRSRFRLFKFIDRGCSVWFLNIFVSVVYDWKNIEDLGQALDLLRTLREEDCIGNGSILFTLHVRKRERERKGEKRGNRVEKKKKRRKKELCTDKKANCSSLVALRELRIYNVCLAGWWRVKEKSAQINLTLSLSSSCIGIRKKTTTTDFQWTDGTGMVMMQRL